MRISDNWTLLILSRYDQLGASSRLRMFQYIPYFEEKGVKVTILPFFDDVYLRNLFHHGKRNLPDLVRAYIRRIRSFSLLKRASVVWIEKELLPFFPGFVETLPRLLGVPYVVDYDDATFHTYDNSASWFVRAFFSKRLTPLLRGAHAITAGNAYLESYANKHGANKVVRIPTVVDVRCYPVLAEPECEEVRVGWIGQPVTTKYLEMLREPLREAGRHHKIKLVTIGASPLKDFCVPLEQIPWTANSEATLLSSIHLGVMPLIDDVWERGKCGYKLIQYMAAGRPVIASPIGVNSEIVNQDVGLLAADSAAWTASLVRLTGDAVARRRMGHAARLRVEQSYSLQVVAPRVYALLSDAAHDR